MGYSLEHGVGDVNESLFESATLLDDVRTGNDNDTIIDCYSRSIVSFFPLKVVQLNCITEAWKYNNV